jgi:hypothetical protein
MAVVAGTHGTGSNLEWLDAGLWKEHATPPSSDGWPIFGLPTIVLVADSMGTPTTNVTRQSGNGG